MRTKLDYVVSAQEVIEGAADQTSEAAHQNGYYQSLNAVFGILSLALLSKLLMEETSLLPPKTLKVPHVPIRKCPGNDMNKSTRAIVVESSVHRYRRRVWFLRMRRARPPFNFL